MRSFGRVQSSRSRPSHPVFRQPACAVPRGIEGLVSCLHTFGILAICFVLRVVLMQAAGRARQEGQAAFYRVFYGPSTNPVCLLSTTKGDHHVDLYIRDAVFIVCLICFLVSDNRPSRVLAARKDPALYVRGLGNAPTAPNHLIPSAGPFSSVPSIRNRNITP